MKICLLTRRFDLSGAGVGRVSGEILKRLQDTEHEIIPISTDGNSLASYLKYSAIDIKRELPMDCNVYHALTPIESLWLPKNKAIVTFHDLFPIAYPDRQGAGIGADKVKQVIASRYFEMCSRVAARCKIITCNSIETKQDMVKYLKIPGDRIIVMKWGIRNNLEPKQKQDNIFRIGYLGQLDRRKRVHLLIEAFMQNKLESELVIGGIGNEERALKQLAEGDSRIKFLGFIDNGELVDFYNSLDLFVFPTAVEGLGFPILEAMACKVPVVVLKDAAIPEIVKSRCAIIPTEALSRFLADAIAYRDNLTWLLSQAGGFGWLLDSNCHFAKEFDWDKTVEGYLSLYKEIAEQNK